MFPRRGDLPSTRSLDSLSNLNTSGVTASGGNNNNNNNNSTTAAASQSGPVSPASESGRPAQQNEVIEFLRSASLADEDIASYRQIFDDQLLRTFGDIREFGEERLASFGVKRGHARRVFAEIERRERERQRQAEMQQRRANQQQRGGGGGGLPTSMSTANLYGALYDVTPMQTPISHTGGVFPSVASGVDISTMSTGAPPRREVRTEDSSVGGGAGGGAADGDVVVVQTSARARNDPMRTAAVVVPGDFACNLCFELLYSARTLQCGHSMCAHCLEKWAATQPNPSCPLCRAPMIPPGSTTAEFTLPAVNSVIEGLTQRCFPGRYARSAKIAEDQRRADEEIRLAFALVRHPADSLLIKVLQNHISIPRPIELLMLRLPRREFLPPSFLHSANRIECGSVSPTHVEGFGFNMTAPSLHAGILQALQLEPGHWFLDAGAGTGIVAAWAAALVGPAGASLAVDSDTGAARLMRRNRVIHDQLLYHPTMPLSGATFSGEMHLVEKRPLQLGGSSSSSGAAGGSSSSSTSYESVMDESSYKRIEPTAPTRNQQQRASSSSSSSHGNNAVLPLAVQILGIERSSASLHHFAGGGGGGGGGGSKASAAPGCIVHASVTLGDSGTSSRRICRMVGTVRLAAKSEHFPVLDSAPRMSPASRSRPSSPTSPICPKIPDQSLSDEGHLCDQQQQQSVDTATMTALTADKNQHLLLFSLREVSVFGSDDSASVFNFGDPQNIDHERLMRLTFCVKKEFGVLMDEVTKFNEQREKDLATMARRSNEDISPDSPLTARPEIEAFGVFVAPSGSATFPTLTSSPAGTSGGGFFGFGGSPTSPSPASTAAAAGAAAASSSTNPQADQHQQQKQQSSPSSPQRRPCEVVATGSMHLHDSMNLLSQLKAWAVDGTWSSSCSASSSSSFATRPHKYHCLQSNIYDMMRTCFAPPATDAGATDECSRARSGIINLLTPESQKKQQHQQHHDEDDDGDSAASTAATDCSDGIFDRVFLACEPQGEADLLRFQKLLRPGGRMVSPHDSSLWVITRAAAPAEDEEEFRRESLYQVGFGTFIPVEDNESASDPSMAAIGDAGDDDEHKHHHQSMSCKAAQRILHALAQEEESVLELERSYDVHSHQFAKSPMIRASTKPGHGDDDDEKDDGNEKHQSELSLPSSIDDSSSTNSKAAVADDEPMYLRCCGSRLANATWADTIDVARIWGNAPFSDGPTVCLKRSAAAAASSSPSEASADFPPPTTTTASSNSNSNKSSNIKSTETEMTTTTTLTRARGASYLAYNLDLCARMSYVACARCSVIVGAEFCDEPLLTQPEGPWTGRVLLCAPMVGRRVDVETHSAADFGERPETIRCNSCDAALALPTWRLRSEVDVRVRHGRRSGGGGGSTDSSIYGLLFSHVRPSAIRVEPPVLKMVGDGNIDVSDCKCANCGQHVAVRIERVRSPFAKQHFAFALRRVALIPGKVKGLPAGPGAGGVAGLFAGIGRAGPGTLMERIYRAIAQSLDIPNTEGAQIVLRDQAGNTAVVDGSNLLTWRAHADEDDDEDDEDVDVEDSAERSQEEQQQNQQQQEQPPLNYASAAAHRPQNPTPPQEEGDDDEGEAATTTTTSTTTGGGGGGGVGGFFDPNSNPDALHYTSQNVREMNRVIAAQLADELEFMREEDLEDRENDDDVVGASHIIRDDDEEDEEGDGDTDAAAENSGQGQQQQQQQDGAAGGSLPPNQGDDGTDGSS